MTELFREPSSHTRPSSLDDLYARSNLTHNQLAFWLGQSMFPAGTTYNLGQLYWLKSDIDPECFLAAFSTLVDRADAFRTTFIEQDGIPQQVVSESMEFTMPIVDFSLEEDAREKAASWCTERVSTPFDLTRCCFDSALLRIGADQWAWYIGMHHLISDGVSIYLTLEYVDRFYALAKRNALGEAESLPRFSAYAAKERAYRSSETCRRDAEFWRDRLASAVEPAEFYGNRRRDGANKSRRMILPFECQRVDKLLSADVEHSSDPARRDYDRLVAYLAVLAAFQLRVANSRCITVGMPFHNRSSADKKGVVGLLMEVSPLRLEVNPEDTFADLLQRARSETQAVRRHYRYGSVNSARNNSYDVLLNVLPPDSGVFEGKPLTSQWLHPGENVEAMALAIQRLPGQGGDKFYFDLNCDLFPGQVADRAAGHFFGLIDALARNPGMKIGKIGMLTPAELVVVEEAHFKAEPLPEDETILSRFERMAADAPDACAVDDGTTALSYGDLEVCANRLASYLRQRGVGSETLVGVCMERSSRMLVALLGILKSGAAYLPLDPGFPQDRLEFMLEDSAARLVITDSKSLSSVSSAGADVLCLDTDWEGIQNSAVADSGVPPCAPENLAYVIYTSGSTGKPKGVQVTHGNVVNFLHSMSRQPGLNADDRLLAVTTLSFDISVLELFLPLSVGATVVLASRGEASDPATLIELLGQKAITVMQATPATWRMLLDAGWQGDRVLKVLCGGEALPVDLARSLATRVGELWNMYGPTETTVWSTCCQVCAPVQTVLIGKPIGNTEVKVVNEYMQPVPLGVPGELYIGGAGVTRGYLNRPELTMQNFVSHAGQRYYKTGDVVCLREDGNLEYRHRVDNQVKLHGHRIEPGEIEAALRLHSSISDAAVVVSELAPGDQRLAAYFTLAADEPKLTAGELRSHLRQSLPDYMLPQHFMELPELPRTPNNKLDRKRLPRPTSLEVRTSRPASNETERKLLEIWQSILKTDGLGVDDNFFDVGGSSILSMQVVARVSREFSVEVPVVTIYECPTVEKLASHLGGRGNAQTVRDLARARVQRRNTQPRRTTLRKAPGNE